MRERGHKGLQICVFNLAFDHGVKDFQDGLNWAAHDYLRAQGVKSVITPAPQGAGAGGVEVVSLVARVLMLLVRVAPLIGRYTSSINEKRVDSAMSRFHIWIYVTNDIDAAGGRELGKEMVLMGYGLKQHLEAKHPLYSFPVQIVVSEAASNRGLQVNIDKARPVKADIGRLLGAIDRRVSGRHFVEYVGISDNSKVKYSYYDK